MPPGRAPFNMLSPGKNRRRNALRTAAAGLAVLALQAGTGGCRTVEAPPDVLDRSDPLAVEFEGAYPAHRSPTGGIRTFHVRASAASTDLGGGLRLSTWAYEDQVPGPTLRVVLGDTLRVHFRNDLAEPTTIHWHGVRVPNPMDGVPGVTQPPIPPGGTFLYEFTPKDAGTFWFHPHVRSSEQVERGLHGVLVVEDPASTPFHRDSVWVLDDWKLEASGALDERFVTRHDLMHDGRWGNVITANGRVDTTIDARPGERIRIRMLNVANGRVFAPEFPGLKPTVVALDGMALPAPIPADRLELAPGNRADLDLVVPTELAGREVVVADRFSRQRPPLVRLRVSGDAVPAREGVVASGYVPEWKRALALPPRHVFRLNARQGGPYGVEWTINDRVMRHEHIDGHQHHGPLNEYPLDLGRFVKLRFVNESSRLHPMHLHGTFFRVLARNGLPVDERAWRDTVLLRPREAVDIGLVPLDPGRWMMHCHILEHAESGMMSLLNVAALESPGSGR